MFGYRSGKYPVTAKALRKLQQAETAAGITHSELEDADGAVVREQAAPYVAKPLREPGEPTLMEQVASLRVCYDQTREELAEANRKLDALIDLLSGKNEPEE